MTAIARELDKKMKTLDAEAASSLERMVREVLDRVEASKPALASAANRLPEDFFKKISEQFGNGPFERPAQGEFDQRGDW